MKTGVTVITPTGDRSQCLEQCFNYVQRQTVRPDQWIIVDDSDWVFIKHPPFNLPMTVSFPFRMQLENGPELLVVPRTKQKDEPAHTLPLNLLEALKHIEYDTVIIMEDDDWYDNWYIELVINMFKDYPNAQVVGQGDSVYYHVPSQRYQRQNNTGHASLCQTAFKASVKRYVELACNQSIEIGKPFVDIKLWNMPIKRHIDLSSRPYCIGMKGLPGRRSNTAGHTQFARYKKDVELKLLRRLIPQSDVEYYQQFMENSGV